MSTEKKILLTGAHGFVGARILLHHPNAVVVPGELVRMPGDALATFVRFHQPEVILNAAAISDIGTCQKDPDASYAANVTLPLVLAKVARDTGAKLISFSSDQVYTGCTEEGPYGENLVLPTPANIYACHKLEAENRVLDVLPEAVLLRATWMYDMPLYDHANRGNFLMNTMKNLLRGQKMGFSSTEFRGITYVRQVVAQLEKMMTVPGGVYNYGSENLLSMFATARALVAALGLTDKLDLVQDTGVTGKHNLWMDCGKLRQCGVLFDSTADGFTRCVGDYGL